MKIQITVKCPFQSIKSSIANLQGSTAIIEISGEKPVVELIMEPLLDMLKKENLEWI
jgi:hypothetical protein